MSVFGWARWMVQREASDLKLAANPFPRTPPPLGRPRAARIEGLNQRLHSQLQPTAAPGVPRRLRSNPLWTAQIRRRDHALRIHRRRPAHLDRNAGPET